MALSFLIPDFLKRRACRYMLHHYLGQYLAEKISLEDLTIDLYNGTGSVSNVPLNIEVSLASRHSSVFTSFYPPLLCQFVWAMVGEIIFVLTRRRIRVGCDWRRDETALLYVRYFVCSVFSEQAINDTLEELKAPVRVCSGRIGKVTVTVPWVSLLKNSSVV